MKKHILLTVTVFFTFFNKVAISQTFPAWGNEGNLYYLDRYDKNAGENKLIYNNNSFPKITMQPGSLIVPQGQSATFTVFANGTAPLLYQWRKNGTDIPRANSSSYTISNPGSADAGQYTVKIFNAYGTVTSNTVTLTITPFNASPKATNAEENKIIYNNNNLPMITMQPGSVTVPPGQSATFRVAANGAAPLLYQWRKNGTDIPRANSSSYTISNPVSADAGQYSVKIFNAYGTVTSNTVTLTVSPFNTSAKATNTEENKLIYNNNNLPMITMQPGSVTVPPGQSATFTVAANGAAPLLYQWRKNGTDIARANSSSYTISNPINSDAGQYSVKIFNAYGTVTSNTVTLTITSPASSASGTITRDYWDNVSGSDISEVPVNTAPISTSSLTIFEGPSNVADNYGSRIRGYISPPTTGNYTFWIASDNGSELWLSTTSNPLNKVKIATVPSYTSYREWTKYPEQQSTPIYLTANTKYYIEAIHKEGTQGDNLSVGWKLPNGTLERPIPGTRLSPFSTSGSTAPVVTIISPTGGSSFGNPSNITINANTATSNGTIVKVEFFEGTNKIGEDLTPPYSYTWMNVSTGNYVLKAVATNSLGSSGTSAVVNVSVANCQTPIIYASGPTTMCSGSVILKTNAAAGNIYQWKKDGENISGATNSTLTVNASGQYQVKVIEGSCITWSAPTTVKIQNELSASITPSGPTTFCSGGHVILYANTCDGYSYQWKKDGINISGANSSTFLVTSEGTYQVRIMQADVKAWSALVNVQINNCAREEDAENNEEIYNPSASSTDTYSEEENFKMKVYPNPSNGLFTIQLSMPSLRDTKVNMKVVNMLGQEVYNRDLVSQADYLRETVELSETLKTGVYTLKITMDDKIESTSIVLAK